jgi:RimJ/RimL family protein N-acetyltransferase
MTLPILSRRLLLRRFTYADIPDLLVFVSHPSVANEVKEMGTTETEIRQYIDKQNTLQSFEKDQVFDLAIELREAAKVIGILTLITKNHFKGEIGYGLGIDYRGQGYATEAASAMIEYAFSVLKYHRIQAIASSANPASWRVMERLGMQREGRLRQASFKDGQWHDLLYYGILVHEWQRRSQS